MCDDRNTGSAGACPPKLWHRRVPPVIPPKKSRAGESPTHHSRYGDGAPGVLNMDGTSSSPADSRKLTADSCKPGVLNGNSSPAASCLLHPTGSVPILEAALSAVLATDEESHLPEPYQRLLSRMDRLCAEVQHHLDKAPTRAGGVPRFRRRRSHSEDGVDAPKSLAGEPAGHAPRVTGGTSSGCGRSPPIR